MLSCRSEVCCVCFFLVAMWLYTHKYSLSPVEIELIMRKIISLIDFFNLEVFGIASLACSSIVTENENCVILPQMTS